MILTVTLNPALDRNIVVERLANERKNMLLEDHVVPGGKGINVSRVLTRLGTRNKVLLLAGGSKGDLLLKLAEQEGVKTIPVRIKNETRTNITLVQLRSTRELRLIEPGPKVSPRELPRLLRTFKRAIRQAKFVVFSGSIAPGISPAFVARLIRTANRAGKKTAVDADGRLLAAVKREHVWLLKPNRDEWRSIGRRAPKAEWVLYSKGSQGAELIGQGVRLKHRLKKQNAVCSVGAGDSMLAGYLHAVAKGSDLYTAFKYALAAGAASVVSPPGRLASAELVRKFLQR